MVGGYVRLVDGTQICRGYDTNLVGDRTISLPAPFLDDDYEVSIGTPSSSKNAISFRCLGARDKTTTSFVYYNAGTEIDYIAIGKWK